MPVQEQAFLEQEALLWPFTGADQYGEPTVSTTPIVLSPKTKPKSNGIRWNSKRRIVRDVQGNTIPIDATVIATFPISINSRIWLGSLDYWNENKPDQEVCIVTWVNITKDIKGRSQLVEVGVQKLHNI